MSASIFNVRKKNTCSKVVAGRCDSKTRTYITWEVPKLIEGLLVRAKLKLRYIKGKGMKSLRKLILYSTFSLHLLYITSYGKSCESKSCSYRGPTIRYPFRIKDVQLKSCGSTGFDVYCDYDSHKTLLEFPSAGNFSVDYIYYYIREIDLSDPDNCLPQKLMSLDLNAINPFRKRGEYQEFQLYNCSGDVTNFDEYDQIRCLSTSDYTVISVGINDTAVLNSNCTFLKTVSAPSSGFLDSKLSNVWSIPLTWNETECTSCDSPKSGSKMGTRLAVTLGALGLGLPAVIIVIVCVCCKPKEEDNQSGNNSSRRLNDPRPQQREMRSAVTSGLDQITIDSYPVLVIGESRRLIMPDDDTCPICLSDYDPHDMLKMLPECLHRFHAPCIDQWLRSKAVCPICRISTPRS